MEHFKQELYENGYFRQEELVFWDCGPDQRAHNWLRVPYSP